jgi:L-cysteine S-thiosulfotransferase
MKALWQILGVWLGLGVLCVTSFADTRTSGHVYLSPQLQALQDDPQRNPVALWQERGQGLWQAQCTSCHGAMDSVKRSVASFPRLSAEGKRLVNLEDQILLCQQRGLATSPVQTAIPAPASSAGAALESDSVLSLSAALHQVAKGERIQVAPSATASPEHAAQWQARLSSGERLYQTRMGRMNLACMHCHDGKVGAQMRADTISQAHPTGFPIYRMAWQTLGSLERRLRACYSGVQAPIPSAGSADLRDLELFLKVRANGMPLDGPSIRR